MAVDVNVEVDVDDVAAASQRTTRQEKKYIFKLCFNFVIANPTQANTFPIKENFPMR